MMSHQPSHEIRHLRRVEATEVRSSDWQDQICRDLQIDTPELRRLIDSGKIPVPKRLWK